VSTTPNEKNAGPLIFDLKTRATFPIRMDASSYSLYTSYKFSQPEGLFYSYEREYYDMLRSTGLKWILQARLGRMDGFFIMYHTTSETLGAQYLPLTELEDHIIGSDADRKIDGCIAGVEELLDAIVKDHPDKVFVYLIIE
jgi:hypothetical protein